MVTIDRIGGRKLAGQLSRRPDVVIIEQCDDRAARGIDAQLPALGRTPAVIAPQQPDPVVSWNGHLHARVRDHDDLVDRIRLVKDRLHSTREGWPPDRGDHRAHARLHRSIGDCDPDPRKCMAENNNAMQANVGIMLYCHGPYMRSQIPCRATVTPSGAHRPSRAKFQTTPRQATSSDAGSSTSNTPPSAKEPNGIECFDE